MKNTIIVDVIMHHQSERSGIPYCHQHVRYSVPIVKVAEEINGTGYRGGEVQNNMGQEDDVSVMSDNRSGPSDILVQ